MSDRYSNIPISEQTRAGMSLNIDDLGAIGRLLSLQDDAYDEQFEKQNSRFSELFTMVQKQGDITMSILQTVVEMRGDISELKEKVSVLNRVAECNGRDIQAIKKDIVALKKKVKILEEEIALRRA
jgi:peptidoglycan hydrolase CwlO-like protein